MNDTINKESAASRNAVFRAAALRGLGRDRHFLTLIGSARKFQCRDSGFIAAEAIGVVMRGRGNSSERSLCCEGCQLFALPVTMPIKLVAKNMVEADFADRCPGLGDEPPFPRYTCAHSDGILTRIMKFAHLIEINDPLNPLIDRLNRDQLWRGLVMRAERPTDFVPYLDRCKILDRSAESISRELHYGDLVVRDRVTFLPQEQVRYDVPQQKDIPTSRLTMTIEEPQPDRFFVRFEYDDGASEETDSEQEFYNEFRRSAYQESDIDTIRTIRQMAEEGRLGEPAA